MESLTTKNMMENTLLRCLERAAELGVYVEYVIAGEGTLPELADNGTNALLETLLPWMVEDCAGRSEAERWMSLHLKREGRTLQLELSGQGSGPVPPPVGNVNLTRYEDSFMLLLELKLKQASA